MLTMAYTGMRWSEAAGLPPGCVSGDTVDIDWKLYELDARFYRGRPKDGSIRTADVPPFLAELLAGHLKARPDRRCTCQNTEPPWCPGGEYVFLGPRRAHFRRSNYATRVVRPAADGWYLERKGPHPRQAAPVLADMSAPWPGAPLAPWPPALPGEPYAPPAGRGIRGSRARRAADAAPPAASRSSFAATEPSSATRRRARNARERGKSRPGPCRSRPDSRCGPG